MTLIWNPPPDSPSRRLPDARFATDPQVAAWLSRLDLAPTTDDDPSTRGMSQDALTYVLKEIEHKRGGGSALGDHIHAAMTKYTPKLSQPTVRGDVEALAHVFAQPEMQAFWSQWTSYRSPRSRGPMPADAGTKAVLGALGMTSHSHGLHAYGDLLEKPQLLEMFARVDAAASDGEPRPLTLPTYAGAMKRAEKLTYRSAFDPLFLQTNAALFRGLCELYPDRGFGKTLLLDGCLFPAWCLQRGTGADEDEEERRRGKTPHAGYRSYRYTGTGKVELDPDAPIAARVFTGSAKYARGYYYVCIIDQASGWPLVSTLIDAATDECKALVTLLSDLYRHFDFIEPEAIAADGAWDENWAHRLCELYYGLAPVFRDTQARQADSGFHASRNQAQTVAGYTNAGQLVCMAHNQPMLHEGFERPARGDLRPGQAAHGHADSEAYRREEAQREQAFRLRATHRHGAGPAQRASLKVVNDWRRLNAFPRHHEGRPDLYAERKALGMRLKNQMEGHFSRMQTSMSLLTETADRVRLKEWDKVRVLLHLAELRMNALSLAAERGHEGVGHTLPTDFELGPLPEAPFGHHTRVAQCRTNPSGYASAVAARASARAAANVPAPQRHAVASALAPAPGSAAGAPEPDEVAPAQAEAAPEPPVSVPAAAQEPERPGDGQSGAEESPQGTDAPTGPLPPTGEPGGAVVIAVDFTARRRRA